MSFKTISILIIGSLGFASFAAAETDEISAVRSLVGEYRFEKNAMSIPCRPNIGGDLTAKDRIRVTLAKEANGSRIDLQIRHQPYREEVGAQSISESAPWFRFVDRADFFAIGEGSSTAAMAIVLGVMATHETKVYSQPILQVEHRAKLRSINPTDQFLSSEDEVQVISWDQTAQRMSYGVTLVSRNARDQVTESRLIEMCSFIKVK